MAAGATAAACCGGLVGLVQRLQQTWKVVRDLFLLGANPNNMEQRLEGSPRLLPLLERGVYVTLLDQLAELHLGGRLAGEPGSDCCSGCNRQLSHILVAPCRILQDVVRLHDLLEGEVEIDRGGDRTVDLCGGACSSDVRMVHPGERKVGLFDLGRRGVGPHPKYVKVGPPPPDRSSLDPSGAAPGAGARHGPHGGSSRLPPRRRPRHSAQSPQHHRSPQSRHRCPWYCGPAVPACQGSLDSARSVGPPTAGG
mmetsp:Transcript_16774/g.43554  ORF Transcript_16774/g.43554 Transcript_16774/m.43554 type:complete len:253 (-) Transcript_16774:114-872(-)